MIHTIGIIGLGNFGSFAAGLLQQQDATVLGYDPAAPASIAGVRQAPLSEVAAADVVILAIPLHAYPAVLTAIAPILPPTSLLIDICSVKTVPVQLLAQYLPKHRTILTCHPLFGSQSAAKSTKGHTLIVTKAVGPHAAEVLRFCKETLGLTITRTTNEAHDKAMAEVQAATFFVARALSNATLGNTPYSVPSFQMLLDLIDFDRTHSDDLFTTIEQGNPFAADIRQRITDSFVQTLETMKEGTS